MRHIGLTMSSTKLLEPSQSWEKISSFWPKGLKKHSDLSSICISDAVNFPSSHSNSEDFSRVMMVEIPGTWPDMPRHTQLCPLAALNSSHAAKATSVRIAAKQMSSPTPIGLEAVVGESLSGCSPSIDSSSQKIYFEKSTHKSGASTAFEFRTSGPVLRPVLRPVHSEGWGELKVKKKNVLETASTRSDTCKVKVPSDETCSKSILKVPRRSHGHPNVSISHPPASISTAPIFASVRPTPGPTITKDGPHLLPPPARVSWGRAGRVVYKKTGVCHRSYLLHASISKTECRP